MDGGHYSVRARWGGLAGGTGLKGASFLTTSSSTFNFTIIDTIVIIINIIVISHDLIIFMLIGQTCIGFLRIRVLVVSLEGVTLRPLFASSYRFLKMKSEKMYKKNPTSPPGPVTEIICTFPPLGLQLKLAIFKIDFLTTKYKYDSLNTLEPSTWSPAHTRKTFVQS